VATATGLAVLPEAAGALADGRITHDHAATLARAATRTPAVLDDEAELVQRAAGQSADAFERTVQAWERRRAADSGATRFERQWSRRSVTVTTGIDDGMTLLQGRLDPVSGATVTAALDRLAEELWRADTSGQGARVVDLHVRRADALVEMARRAMAVDPARGKRPDPAVMVLIDHRTLLGELAETGVCQLVDGSPLAPATARRLACSAGILPVVLDGRSRPLDLGTSQRYASAAQRLALIARDAGCVFPGCDRPHPWCDAHHLDEFPRGPTDLENLALVCEAHHHTLHEGRWTLAPTADGGWRARSPAGQELIRRPRCAAPPSAGRESLPDPPAGREPLPDRPAAPAQLDLLAG
jgi:hypothetical protein